MRSLLRRASLLVAAAAALVLPACAPAPAAGMPACQPVVAGASAATMATAHGSVRVYRPDPRRWPGTRPGVLLVHGGSWVGGDPSSLNPQACELVATGYVVGNVSYRLATVAPWPAPADDVSDAWLALRASAGSLRLDASRVAFAGESAGGQLALVVAGRLNVALRPRAVVSWSGPTDLTMLMTDPGPSCRTGPECGLYLPMLQTVPRTLLRCAPASCSAAETSASPVSFITAGYPATLQTFFTHDLVPSSQGSRLAAALDAAGVTNKLVVLTGYGHALGGDATVWTTTRQFLLQQLG